MNKFIKHLCFLTVVCLVLFSLVGCGNDGTDNGNGEETNISENASNDNGYQDDSQQKAQITNGFTTNYTPTAYAVIDVKDYGKIKVGLAGNEAPETVKNFIKLAESKFYDGLTFHRVMPGFVIQGGDPKGNGSGGSDQNIKGEFLQNGFNNRLSHIRGAISMARNSFDLNSASSQFFIVHNDSAIPSLDGMYACFGYVTEGMEIVDKICENVIPTDSNGTVPSDKQPIINSVTITYP